MKSRILTLLLVLSMGIMAQMHSPPDVIPDVGIENPELIYNTEVFEETFGKQYLAEIPAKVNIESEVLEKAFENPTLIEIRAPDLEAKSFLSNRTLIKNTKAHHQVFAPDLFTQYSICSPIEDKLQAMNWTLPSRYIDKYIDPGLCELADGNNNLTS